MGGKVAAAMPRPPRASRCATSVSPPAMGRLAAYVRRPEVRARPASTLLRRSYYEVVARAAPKRLERPHRSTLFGTDYVFSAPLTESVGRSLFLYGVYEPVATDVFASLLRPDDVAIDVGAHYGDFTLVAAAKVGPEGAVYAFEPQDDIRTILVRNLADNRIRQVVVAEHALADYDGTAALYTAADPIHTGGASLSAEHVGQSQSFTPVRVRRLDDVIPAPVRARVTAIKIDVEGAEAAVLRGAGDLLSEARPAVLFEVNGLPCGTDAHDSESMTVLREFGYELFGMVRDEMTRFRLEPVARGQDPMPYSEPWLALNLLAVAPGSPVDARLRAAGHLL